MPPSNGKILVVDDQIEMVRLLADQLTDEGYFVELAGGGREALKAIASASFDLVLTDLRMKDVDGFDVLATVRARAPFVPVIVMTAFGTSETASEAARRGAHHHLDKPFRLDELLLHVESALDERHMAEQLALRRDLDGIVSVEPSALPARRRAISWDREAGARIPAASKDSPSFAWAVGGTEASALREILTDVLDEIGVKVMRPASIEARAGASRRSDRPDFVLAITRQDDPSVVEDARRLADDASVLVVLARGTRHRLRATSTAAELARDPEDPLLRVQAEVLRLLERLRRSAKPVRGSGSFFRIGERGRAAIAILRQRALHGGAGPIPEDAEARLERAIQLDLDMDRLRGTLAPAGAFTFGLHARVELTLLRLLTSEIGLLERAIRSDGSPSGRG
jgi:DNA-binding response OmpR family regulator